LQFCHCRADKNENKQILRSLFVQTINILIVNQSVIDLCASFFTLIVALVEVDGTRMSRDSIYHQFVCRIWITRVPVWVFVNTSTYGILIIALERYIAVVYPIWYNVRMHCYECLPRLVVIPLLIPSCCHGRTGRQLGFGLLKTFL